MADFGAIFLMAIALGTDVFSMGLSMGLFRMSSRSILLFCLTVGFFHAVFPVLGMAAGRLIGLQFGHMATLAGGLLLIMIGLHLAMTGAMQKMEQFLFPVGIGALLIPISVSLDSFSIGLSLGTTLNKSSIMMMLIFGGVATTMSWLGILLGRKIQGIVGVYSQIVGGSILLAFGLKIILQ